jgi:hypothetical protein
MWSQATQSQVGVHHLEHVGVQNPDRAATLDSWLLDVGLLAAVITTMIFFAVHLL